MRALPFYLAFSIPLVVVLGFAKGGAWTGLGIAFVFGAIPLLDAMGGLRTDNQDADGAVRRWRFDLALVVAVVFQLGLQAWALGWLLEPSRTALEIVLGTLTMGVMSGGIGITVAHELMHRGTAWERGLAELVMTSVTYTHFCIEHVHGHHRNVATPRDPATSRLGESVYAFLPRSIASGIASAFAIERERVRRAGIGWIDPRNRITRYAASTVAMYLAIALLLSPLAALLFLAHGGVAIVLLEVINYVEHYGLLRRELEPGRFERVQPWHSWNASHRVTNWLLLNLQRHSDHHFLASRPFHRLRHFDDVPQLPAGYATMVLVALVPPLWRRVMDPRALQARARTCAAA